jgi:hypothetical protein
LAGHDAPRANALIHVNELGQEIRSVQARTLGLVERPPDRVEQGEGEVGVGCHGGLNRRGKSALVPGLAGKPGDPANRVPVVA